MKNALHGCLGNQGHKIKTTVRWSNMLIPRVLFGHYFVTNCPSESCYILINFRICCYLTPQDERGGFLSYLECRAVGKIEKKNHLDSKSLFDLSCTAAAACFVTRVKWKNSCFYTLNKKDIPFLGRGGKKTADGEAFKVQPFSFSSGCGTKTLTWLRNYSHFYSPVFRCSNVTNTIIKCSSVNVSVENPLLPDVMDITQIKEL